MSDEGHPVDPNPASDGDGAPEAEGVVHEEDPSTNVTAVVAGVAGASLMDADDDDDDDDDDDEAGEVDGIDGDDMDDENEDPMSVLPPYVVRRVEKLKTLNSTRDEIMEQYLKDRAELEMKYQNLCKVLYDKRAQIIKGDFDDEIAQATETTKEDEAAVAAPEEIPGAESTEKAVGIPQFWVCAMGHMEAVAELITEEDVDCLEHLQDITCTDDPEGKGFTLSFHFAPNDYFHDTVLTKRYEVPNLLLADEPILKNVEGCRIKWKEGRSLTHREVQKKQRGKGKNAGQIRTVSKKERAESFFHFFEPPKMPSMEEMDEEEADRLEEAFEHDYDVAQAFRSHIIPKAVLWFAGQAMEEEMADMLSPVSGTESASNPFPPSAPGEQPPECQQN